MIKRLIAIFLFIFPLGLWAQNKGIELNITDRYELHKVVPAGENGFLLINGLERDTRSKDNKWEVVQYNPDFTIGWSKSYKVSNKFDYENQTMDKDELYVLFSRYSHKSLILCKINVKTGEFTSKEFKVFARVSVRQFSVFDGNVFMGGLVNNNLTLLHFNFNSTRLRTLETINTNNGYIETMDTDIDGKEVNVVMVNRIKKRSFITLKKFAPTGEQLSETVVDFGEDRNLLTGNLSKVSTNEYWLIGSYGMKEAFTSTGIYIAGMINNELSWIRFYSFDELKGFMSYISIEDKEEYIQKFVRKKDQEKASFEYRIVPHQLRHRNGEILLIAEACFPKYETVRETYFDATGMPHSTFYEVFQGWKYTHTQLIGFDFSGRVTWSESFPIEQITTPVVRKTINVNDNQKQPLIAYLHDQKIKSIEVVGTKLKPKYEKDVSMYQLNDQVQMDEPADMEHWYGDNYLAWGVRVKGNGSDKQRKVFYCDKIDFSNNGNKY